MQAPHNSILDDLRGRLKADPKNRIFYPLAEELRKAGQLTEAEQVLRVGLTHHPTYLSAWVGLGRVLREISKDSEAIEALVRAMQLDPGNVVVARLLGDAYLAIGEKIEAIKKYKLVLALMPGDDELVGTIARLDREINSPVLSVAAAADDDDLSAFNHDTPVVAQDADAHEAADVFDGPEAAETPEEIGADAEIAPVSESPDWADETAPPFELASDPVSTGDSVPMLANHDDSPFEEPLQAEYTQASLDIEAPGGMHIIDAPLSTEVAAPWGDEPEVPSYDDEEDEPVEQVSAEPPAINTLTMAELYTRQGMTEQARRIYLNILEREPDNDSVRQRLLALDVTDAAAGEMPSNERRIAALRAWLDRVTGGEAPRV